MKLPLETMTGTVVAGIILTIIFAVLAFGVSGGWIIDLVLVLVIWLVMFALLRKPTPPKA